ncbi:hypothetical protein [Bradyrhizobium acaciae]|uniref:hypothetical protein n=1 Tax=Bradyrhizobium acaciae TaxID=2683706 RepID=UPI001E41324B|nr:hypothetical protein [Bradyrhizobium acaciae]MCC8982036.1 hypothetical protein [Bradyrhizobium acaciae]
MVIGRKRAADHRADWQTVDKAIDRALEAVPETNPDAAKCKQALAELLTIMDQMQA